jgi:Fungal protein kinase
MYDQNSKSGVLVDYDVSSSTSRPDLVVIPRSDRKDATPFMAVDLQSGGYWKGEIEREYRHELEAFIWILTFVFLQYQNGLKRPRQTVVDTWLTSSYKWKVWIILGRLGKYCQSDFKDHVELAEGPHASSQRQ